MPCAPKSPRELCEHAGQVVDGQAHVAGADHVVGRQHGQVAVVAVVLQEAGSARAHDRQQVADHGGGGLVAAGARALQRHLSDRVAAQHDGVEAAIHAREGMVSGTSVGATEAEMPSGPSAARPSSLTE